MRHFVEIGSMTYRLSDILCSLREYDVRGAFDRVVRPATYGHLVWVSVLRSQNLAVREERSQIFRVSHFRV